MKRNEAPFAAKLRLTLSALAIAGVAAFGTVQAQAQTATGGDQKPAAAAKGSDLLARGWNKVAVPNPEDESKKIYLVTDEARDKNNVPQAEITIRCGFHCSVLCSGSEGYPTIETVDGT